jgi:hypothetical protein
MGIDELHWQEEVTGCDEHDVVGCEHPHDVVTGCEQDEVYEVGCEQPHDVVTGCEQDEVYEVGCEQPHDVVTGCEQDELEYDVVIGCEQVCLGGDEHVEVTTGCVHEDFGGEHDRIGCGGGAQLGLGVGHDGLEHVDCCIEDV